jgi:hypothetical protein
MKVLALGMSRTGTDCKPVGLAKRHKTLMLFQHFAKL